MTLFERWTYYLGTACHVYRLYLVEFLQVTVQITNWYLNKYTIQSAVIYRAKYMMQFI